MPYEVINHQPTDDTEHDHVTPPHSAYIATSEQITNQYWKHVRSHCKQ